MLLFLHLTRWCWNAAYLKANSDTSSTEGYICHKCVRMPVGLGSRCKGFTFNRFSEDNLPPPNPRFLLLPGFDFREVADTLSLFAVFFNGAFSLSPAIICSYFTRPWSEIGIPRRWLRKIADLLGQRERVSKNPMPLILIPVYIASLCAHLLWYLMEISVSDPEIQFNNLLSISGILKNEPSWHVAHHLCYGNQFD